MLVMDGVPPPNEIGLDLFDDEGVKVRPELIVGLNIFKLPVGLGLGLFLKMCGSGFDENFAGFGVSLLKAVNNKDE